MKNKPEASAAKLKNKVLTQSAKIKNKLKNSEKKSFAGEKLELLITVVGRSKAEFYLDLIQSFGVNMQATALARGTADRKMLDLLGLADSDKAVIFSVVNEKRTGDLTHALAEKFRTIKNGKGVAFVVPLTSVIGSLIFGFLSDNRQFGEVR